MIVAAFLKQDCPVCGRPARVAVELTGAPVFCGHCGGRFVAIDGPSSCWPDAEKSSLVYVEQLLARSMESATAPYSKGISWA